MKSKKSSPLRISKEKKNKSKKVKKINSINIENNNNKSLNEKSKNKSKLNSYQLPMLSYPKNVNDYAHIIKKVDCQPSDVEFLLFLRTENKPAKAVKEGAPGYYEEDLNKFKKRYTTTESERRFMRTNYSTFKNLFQDRSTIAVNKSQFMYETTLRFPKEPKKIKIQTKENEKKSDIVIHKNPWNSTQFHKGENLFETLLPPILQTSKNNVEKIKNFIPHPFKKINRPSPSSPSIPQHLLEPDQNLYLRSPAEAGTIYKDAKGLKNFCFLRHLTLNSGNEFVKWANGLRGGKI